MPGVFNINEPILFGAPIIMNPLFFPPFVLVPMVNATPAYFALKLDPGQPRSVDDAVDNAGAYRRLVGGELEL